MVLEDLMSANLNVVGIRNDKITVNKKTVVVYSITRWVQPFDNL